MLSLFIGNIYAEKKKKKKLINTKSSSCFAKIL